MAQQNTCAIKVYDNGCVEKRTCRSCLSLTPTADGLECFLDAKSGVCATFSELPSSPLASVDGVANTTAQLELLEEMQVYNSAGQKYCSENDGACTLCETVANLKGYAPSTNQLKRMSSDRNICYGSNDCICVAKCEGREWIANAGNRCETSSLPSYSTPSPASKNTESKLLTFIGIFALIQLSVLVVLFIRKKRQLRLAREANGPYNNPAILRDQDRLELPGWMAWQRQLRANDKKKNRPTVSLHKLRPSSSLHLTTNSESSITTMPLSSPQSAPETSYVDHRESA